MIFRSYCKNLVERGRFDPVERCAKRMETCAMRMRNS